MHCCDSSQTPNVPCLVIKTTSHDKVFEGTGLLDDGNRADGEWRLVQQPGYQPNGPNAILVSEVMTPNILSLVTASLACIQIQFSAYGTETD